MKEISIEEYIDRELSSEEQKAAIEFVRFLRDNQLEFYIQFLNFQFYQNNHQLMMKNQYDLLHDF